MSSIFLKAHLASTTRALPARLGTPSATHRQRPRGPLAWLRERLHIRAAPPLQLEFPDRFVHFRGLREFEFAMASRIDFPASRVHELMAMTPADLERAAGAIRDIERRFADILTHSVQEPALVGEFLHDVELALFSQDHAWREIMAGLLRLGPTYNAYKRVALVKYMQYLRARQTVMRSVFLDKTREDLGARVHVRRTTDRAGAPALGDTAAYERTEHTTHGDPDGGFACLPKGETVRIGLGASRQMDLLLAGMRMRLYTGRECYMVDEGNGTYPLRAGKNLVGRHSECDVVVNAACRAVSRHHLIVEPDAEGHVLLTDLSSHGTEIASALMPGH